MPTYSIEGAKIQGLGIWKHQLMCPTNSFKTGIITQFLPHLFQVTFTKRTFDIKVLKKYNSIFGIEASADSSRR